MHKYLIVIYLILFKSNYLIGHNQTLINGEKVRKGEYPEVVRIQSCENGMCASCTGAVVGPEALLTAGHCLKEQKKISFSYEQKIYYGQCESHPFYPNVEDVDMALCKLDKKIDVKYAHISKEIVELDETITLIGYGCLKKNFPRGGNDGILRVGESKVVQLPKIEPVNNWFYTFEGSALCFGDSGGPAFKEIKNPKREKHYISGVNSRGNIVDLSLFTALYLDKSINFIDDWMGRNDVIICGYSDDISCGEEVEKSPNECKKEYKKIEYYSAKLDKWNGRLNQCLSE